MQPSIEAPPGKGGNKASAHSSGAKLALGSSSWPLPVTTLRVATCLHLRSLHPRRRSFAPRLLASQPRSPRSELPSRSSSRRKPTTAIRRSANLDRPVHARQGLPAWKLTIAIRNIARSRLAPREQTPLPDHLQLLLMLYLPLLLLQHPTQLVPLTLPVSPACSPACRLGLFETLFPRACEGCPQLMDRALPGTLRLSA